MGGKLGILALLLAPLLCVDVVRGFEWDNSRKNIVYACAGGSMVFPWHYKVTEAETVMSINWIHDGAQSSTIMATMVHNHFMTTSGYRGRVRHVTNAGLILKGLSAEESGNYTVQVNVLTGGKYQAFRQTVHLHVMEGLMLEGDLKADQDPEARWDEDSQSWLIRLTCGTFTFPSPPLLDVKWRTPDKEKKPSSGYESGHFYLSLASPVKGGVYRCSIPKSRLRDICYKEHGGNDSVALSAAVTVDETKARLSFLEANQKTLLADNKQLREQHVQDMQSMQQTHVQGMQNVTDVMENLEEQMQSGQQSMKDHLVSMNKTVTDLTDEVLRDSVPISFHARLSSNIRLSYGSIIKLPKVISNQGQGYDPSTGYFTAPMNGTYFFIGTTGPYGSSGNLANMDLMFEGSMVARTYLHLFSNHYIMGSCHAALYMVAGQKVWLQSSYSNSYFESWVTSFSGFRT